MCVFVLQARSNTFCVFVLQARYNTFCVSLFYTLGLIHFPFCLKFLFVVIIITFLVSSLFYMMFYQNCRVTSYYFVVLLKQTTQVKTLSIAHVTQFHDSRSPFNVSGGQSQQRLVFSARIIPFGIREATNLALCIVSLGTFHSAVSIFTLTLPTHILTTVHIT